MKIGDLARQARTTQRTLRYYEKLGLLAPAAKSDGGHRHYDQDAVIRLHKIDAMKRAGMSLEDIAAVLPLYFEEPEDLAGKKAARAALEARRGDLADRMACLKVLEDDLQRILNRLDAEIRGAEQTVTPRPGPHSFARLYGS